MLVMAEKKMLVDALLHLKLQTLALETGNIVVKGKEQSFKTDFGKFFSEDERQVPVLVQVLTSRMGMDAAFVQYYLVHMN